jgi:hypothetical protein
MALATTTLSAAVAVGDTSIVVASATSVAAGRLIRIDNEVLRVGAGYASGTTVPVIRGLEGTVTAAHVSGANVTHGLASDFASPVAGGPQSFSPNVRARTVTSYGAATAITLPTPGSDAVAILNGTVALAMTLANPTKDQDGDFLYIIGNGKAAHTVTYTAGFGNAGGNYDVATFATGGQNGILAVAANGIWVALSSMTGTLTAMVPAIA